MLHFPVIFSSLFVSDNILDDFILIGDNTKGAASRLDINNNYSHTYIVFPNWIYSYDIDYDPVDHIIYWMSDNRDICSGSLFGNSEITVRSKNGLSYTGGIAVDSISRLLFYTDMGNHVIAAIRLGESQQKTVVKTSLGYPSAIVTDPINGTIYWADSESPGKIEKSNYDGTNRQELVNTGLSSLSGLAVDIYDGVLYWCNIGTFTIERANVDGSNRSLIYQDQIRVEGCSIALYHSYLYFTTWWSRYSIMRIRTDGRELISLAASEYIYPVAIHVHINGRLGNNGCSNASGGCSHFCFPLPGGYKKCACPDLMTLQADGKTCRYGKYLFYNCSFSLL
ncbi:hypothetical protein ACJMK2_022984 [Sinanodonta woodiana]|uniref:Prolow-density lipoprotein receptor-related protein 1-like beta-propeller domain-containing protein n=1 Tax=Sinanodonta woodiana TaxID=1069815 RepID=A0ABD3TMI0_SINWO